VRLRSVVRSASAGGLRGAIVGTGQLVYLAPVLAETMGITVCDD
jgi:hypothetical protein